MIFHDDEKTMMLFIIILEWIFRKRHFYLSLSIKSSSTDCYSNHSEGCSVQNLTYIVVAVVDFVFSNDLSIIIIVIFSTNIPRGKLFVEFVLGKSVHQSHQNSFFSLFFSSHFHHFLSFGILI
jgi:hypothetical protein